VTRVLVSHDVERSARLQPSRTAKAQNPHTAHTGQVQRQRQSAACAPSSLLLRPGRDAIAFNTRIVRDVRRMSRPLLDGLRLACQVAVLAESLTGRCSSMRAEARPR
jgi:hypothetical protein